MASRKVEYSTLKKKVTALIKENGGEVETEKLKKLLGSYGYSEKYIQLYMYPLLKAHGLIRIERTNDNLWVARLGKNA